MKDIDLFNKLIRESISESKYEIDEVSDYRYYYDNEYAKPIIRCYKLLNLSSKEFNLINTKYGGKRRKICSVASSGRLCFLYLFGSQFEYRLLNATRSEEIWKEPSVDDAQLDAKNGNIYYECKCQEIFNRKDGLPKSYVPVLKEYFGIDNLIVSNNLIKAKLSDFHIGLDKSYCDTRFDFKQLFTHLCALIKLNKEKKDALVLKYIFFKPKEELIKGTVIENVYKELEEERTAIKNSEIIKIALQKYNIMFEYEDVYVDDDRLSRDPKELLKQLEIATIN